MNKRMLIYASMFVLAVITGITIGVLGRPYDTAMFALHKILSIGAIILAVIFIRKQMKETGITSTARTSIIVLSISAFALIATGAMMSIDVGPYDIIKTIHMLAPVITAAAIVLTIISFGRNLREDDSAPGVG